jgi:thioredoxin 1
MASNRVLHLTSESLETAMKSETPVLVDFWAPWCGPCKMVAPILDELAEELGDKLQIAKMNVDDDQEILSRFGFRGIPAFVIFQNGEVKAQAVGAMPKSSFQRFIAPHISQSA